MSNTGPTKESVFNQKNALVSAFLLATAFVWYLSAFRFLETVISLKNLSIDLSLSITGFNFLAFIFSAIIGTRLIERFKNRKKWLKYWMLTGLFVSSLFALINFADFFTLLVLGCVVGAYFGIGMPVFAGYFAACTEPKNRAKFGGVVIFMLVTGVPTLSLISNLDTYILPIVLGLWLIPSLVILIFKAPENEAEAKNRISYRSIFSNRSFLLYIIPWLMFSLINDLPRSVIANSFSIFPSFFAQGHSAFTTIIAGICSIVFGFLADKKGRKRLALIGLAILGMGYAALSLFSGNYLAAWFYVLADGIAWGAFTMLFITTLWGDISQGNNGEKYYLLGVLPYLFSTYVGGPVGDYLLENNLVSEITVFSLAAFFLFAATLPLFYAPETLPEKVLKDMDLISYVEKAKKKAQVDTIKASKKHKTLEEKSSNAIEEDSNYKEAEKLAEKYY